LQIILNLVQQSNEWKITVYRKWGILNTKNMQIHLKALKTFLAVVLTMCETTVLHITHISLAQNICHGKEKKKLSNEGKTYTGKNNSKITTYIHVSTNIHKHSVIQFSYKDVVLQHSSFAQ
jgi:hypothetical protein